MCDKNISRESAWPLAHLSPTLTTLTPMKSLRNATVRGMTASRGEPTQFRYNAVLLIPFASSYTVHTNEKKTQNCHC